MSQLETNRLSVFYDAKRGQYDPLQQRLAHEHLLVDELCAEHDDIGYKLIHSDQMPPLDYQVTFTGLKSIVGIDKDQLPLYGENHMLEIRMTPGYPMEPPVCYMISKVWHPNIQSEAGPFEGRICGNTEGFGSFYSLDQLILRIRAMLAWETYHAEMTDPYPEDENVARWVREYAEPLGIVSQGLGIDHEWTLPANWKSLVTHEKKIRISMV